MLLLNPLLELEMLLLDDPAELDGFNNANGTATSFSPVVAVDDALVEVDELLLLLVGSLVAVELSWMTAKSIFPEFGLITTSLIVPNCSPEVVWTWAPVSFVARMPWFMLLRPVALRPLWCFDDQELPLELEVSLLEPPGALPELLPG